MMILHETARHWRENNGYVGKGGVVLLYREQVYGWKAELCDPHHERPGALAVDEEGTIWMAQGGNDQDGAKEWKLFSRVFRPECAQ